MTAETKQASTYLFQPLEGEQVKFSDPFTNCVQRESHAALIRQAINEVKKDIENGAPGGNRIATGSCDHRAVVNYNNYVIVNVLLVESI